MALYAIGDIHGCLTALKTVVKASDIQPGDTLVLLGDYVSRGPDSARVIKWILKKQAKYNIVTLRGNHEVAMLRARRGKKELKEWLKFGGDTVLASYGIAKTKGWDNKIPAAHWEFLESTLKYWKKGKYIFVHAGLIPGKPLKEHNNHTLFWRKFRTPAEYEPGKVVICGHTSRKNGKIADFGHAICLDTYAYGGKWLSCLDVKSRAFWQANQKGKMRSGKLP